MGLMKGDTRSLGHASCRPTAYLRKLNANGLHVRVALINQVYRCVFLAFRVWSSE